MSESPAIFVVDPDPAFGKSIALAVKETNVQVNHYADAESFRDGYVRRTPGCLVSELRLPGMSGLQLQQWLTRDSFSLPVIFVTSHPVTSLIVQAMQQGAITVLDKPCDPQALRDAIGKALSKDQTIRRIDAKHTELQRRLDRLTPKERLVLDLMVKGTANKVIARNLEVSVRTVEARRHQIFKKTGTDSIAELVRFILQAGYSDDE